jgi:hypothetical protein
MAVAGRRRKWAALDAQEERVRRAVLRHFAAGHGPLAARDLGAVVEEPEAVLQRLRQRDLIVQDVAGVMVTAAYPFSGLTTAHRVTVRDVTVHALCSIDALGVGGMLGADAVISSACAHCGAPVKVVVCEGGQRLHAHQPAAAVVWAGTRYEGGCAATSGCTLKPFFCSAAHLETWRGNTDPGGAGIRLSVQAAFQVGLALFGPMLMAAA